MKTKTTGAYSRLVKLLMLPFTILLFSVFTTELNAQILPLEPEEAVVEDVIPYDKVQVKPMFESGEASTFSNWCVERIAYPQQAKEQGEEGRVELSAVIDIDGSLTNVEVKMSSGSELLDNEALRVAKQSPKWTPGQQDGKNVKVSYTFTVDFKL